MNSPHSATPQKSVASYYGYVRRSKVKRDSRTRRVFLVDKQICTATESAPSEGAKQYGKFLNSGQAMARWSWCFGDPSVKISKAETAKCRGLWKPQTLSQTGTDSARGTTRVADGAKAMPIVLRAKW
jgi:hypothetical protein